MESSPIHKSRIPWVLYGGLAGWGLLVVVVVYTSRKKTKKNKEKQRRWEEGREREREENETKKKRKEQGCLSLDSACGICIRRLEPQCSVVLLLPLLLLTLSFFRFVAFFSWLFLPERLVEEERRRRGGGEERLPEATLVWLVSEIPWFKKNKNWAPYSSSKLYYKHSQSFWLDSFLC